MTERHYIVSNQDGIWQFSTRGNTRSHFESRDHAIIAAVEAAKEAGEADAEVIVQDINKEQSTVWRAGEA